MKQLMFPQPQAKWHGDAGAQNSPHPSGLDGSVRLRRAAAATRGAPDAVATGAAAAHASLDTNVHRSMSCETWRTNIVISGASSLEPFADKLPSGASTMGLLDDRLRLFRIAGDPLGGDTPSGTDHEEVRGDEGLVSPSDGAVPLQQDNQV